MPQVRRFRLPALFHAFRGRVRQITSRAWAAAHVCDGNLHSGATGHLASSGPAADSKAGGRGLVAAAAIYAILLGAVSWKHTFWRDEAQAWLIARDSNSLASVVHHVRYEGHPPLWHFVLYFFSRFTWNPEWMKLPNYLFSVVTAGLILSAARLPVWVRIGFVFSYFMLFEYAVVDRNYMIGVMFLVAALTQCRDDASGVKTSIALSLAALTSLPALIVACCLYPVHLVSRAGAPLSGEPGQRLRGLSLGRATALMTFAVSVLAALAIIRPPGGASAVLTHGRWTPLQHLLRFSDVTEAYLPIPGSLHFWNSSLFFNLGRWVSPAVGLALAVPLCLWFQRREVRYFFIAASCLLMAEMAAANVFQMRHVGWLFVVFLLAVILECEAEPNQTSAAGPGDWSWRRFLLLTILTAQVATGAFACELSMRYPFSPSKQVADFLRQRHLDRAPIVFFPDYAGGAVLAYLERPSVYSIARHAQVSFMIWDEVEARPQELPSKAEVAAASENGIRPVVITKAPLPKAEAATLGMRCIAFFGGGLSDEEFYVYR